jgi:hypothetical protein
MRARVLRPPVLLGVGVLAIITGVHALISGPERALEELPVRAVAVIILALLWMRRLHRLNVR